MPHRRVGTMGRRERLKNCCQRSWAAFVRPLLAGNAADEKQAAEAGAALRATEERASRAELIYQEEERVPYVAAATSLTPQEPLQLHGDCGEPKWSCQKQPAFCRLCGACRFSRHSGLFPLLNDFQKSHLAPPCTMLRAFVAGKGQCLLIRVVCAGQPRLPRLALTPCPRGGRASGTERSGDRKGCSGRVGGAIGGPPRLHFGCLRF